MANITNSKTMDEAWTTQKLSLNAVHCYKKRKRDPLTCWWQKTADCTGLPVLAPSMHCRRCMNERISLTDALAQVPHKTPLGMKES